MFFLFFVNFYLEEVFFYKDIVFILVFIWFVMVFNIVIGLILYICKKLENYFLWLKIDFVDRGEGMSCFFKLVVFICVVIISFCFCWMLIGIMFNLIWGLIVVFIICFIFVFFIYVVYEYLILVSCK